MIKNKQPITLLLIGILSMILFLYEINTISPSYVFTFATIHIPSIIPFFILIFFILFGFAGAICRSITQGIVAGIIGIAYLLLRMLGITHWFFMILLILLFAVIELFLLQKNT